MNEEYYAYDYIWCDEEDLPKLKEFLRKKGIEESVLNWKDKINLVGKSGIAFFDEYSSLDFVCHTRIIETGLAFKRYPAYILRTIPKIIIEQDNKYKSFKTVLREEKLRKY